MIETDVVVVGGGPAGSSCAGELLRRGFDVTVLDRSSFPRDKLCAGWVPPGLFRRLGIRPEEYPHGIREYRSLHFRIRGLPLPVPTRQYAIRRVELDAWLLERSGADVRRHRVQKIERAEGGPGGPGGRTGGEAGYIIDESYSCRYLVGAGGTGCPVAFFARNAEDGEPDRRERLIVTVEEEFPCRVSGERCYLRFFDHGLQGYSWYFPKADGYLTVGIGGKQAYLARRNETIRGHWRAFRQLLERRGLVTDREFSPSGHSYYLRGEKPVLGTEGIYLVGDAAGLATLDMGEGIEPAVHSGLLAARAIAGGGSYSVEQVKKKSLPEILRPGP